MQGRRQDIAPFGNMPAPSVCRAARDLYTRSLVAEVESNLVVEALLATKRIKLPRPSKSAWGSPRLLADEKCAGRRHLE